MIGRDTFMRTEDLGWGTDELGSPWTVFPDDAMFSVAAEGLFEMATGAGYADARLNHAVVGDTLYRVVFTPLVLADTPERLIFQIRNNGVTSRQRAELELRSDHVRLRLLEDGNNLTGFDTVSMGAVAGTPYVIELSAIGGTLCARFAPLADPLPITCSSEGTVRSTDVGTLLLGIEATAGTTIAYDDLEVWSFDP